MSKKTALFKKIALAALVVAIGVAAFPIISASAAGPKEPAAQPNDFRLEQIWVREQATYQLEGNRLSNANNFIARVQALIDKANQKGWDTSSVQAALNALSAVIPTVQIAHIPGAAIIISHAGFYANGKVTDRTSAIATAKSLAQVLKDTRAAMNGTGKALHAAIQAFRNAHPRPTTAPVS